METYDKNISINLSKTFLYSHSISLQLSILMNKLVMGLEEFNKEDKSYKPILYMAPNKQRRPGIIIIKLVLIYLTDFSLYIFI